MARCGGIPRKAVSDGMPLNCQGMECRVSTGPDTALRRLPMISDRWRNAERRVRGAGIVWENIRGVSCHKLAENYFNYGREVKYNFTDKQIAGVWRGGTISEVACMEATLQWVEMRGTGR